MDGYEKVLISLGRIEGRLHAFDKLPERVAALEQWQSWLKGGWAALAAAYLYLCCQTFTR